jgi:hypothetical protein
MVGGRERNQAPWPAPDRTLGGHVGNEEVPVEGRQRVVHQLRGRWPQRGDKQQQVDVLRGGGRTGKGCRWGRPSQGPGLFVELGSLASNGPTTTAAWQAWPGSAHRPCPPRPCSGLVAINTAHSTRRLPARARVPGGARPTLTVASMCRDVVVTLLAPVFDVMSTLTPMTTSVPVAENVWEE